MLHQRITEKGVMHTVACQLADDLKEALDIYEGYTVEKREWDEDARVLVYSDTHCNILTDSCVEKVLEVVKVYSELYDCVDYHIGTAEFGMDCEKRVLPCIYACLNVQKVR